MQSQCHTKYYGIFLTGICEVYCYNSQCYFFILRFTCDAYHSEEECTLINMIMSQVTAFFSQEASVIFHVHSAV